MYLDSSWLDMAGRLLIVFFFLAAGLRNIAPAQARDHIERMAAFKVPYPTATFWFGMALQFNACALVLSGWHAEIGVWCLIVFTIVANAIFHRFWIYTDQARRSTVQLLLLNGVATLGGLLLLLENVR